jgi:hypothetical protein
MSAPRVRPSRCISVGIEADGPIPGPYSMLSIGAAVAGTQDAGGFTPADPQRQTFYRELRPISAEFVPEALRVSGLDRERLAVEGAEPAVALAEFSAWVREVSAGAQPVMCGCPAPYDWTFLYAVPPPAHAPCSGRRRRAGGTAGEPHGVAGSRRSGTGTWLKP